MSKSELLSEIDRIKREKPEKWKWIVKGICNHLAWRDGAYEREKSRNTEITGRKLRDPKCYEPAHDDFDDESEP